MAKRHRKGKRSKHRKSHKRSRAAKRAYRGSALWRYNQRRKKRGHKKHRKGKKRRRSGKRKHRRASGGHGHGVMYYRTYQSLINRGRHPQAAHKIAMRVERMAHSRIKRGVAAQMRQQAGESAMANLFANIGTAGRVAHRLG